MTTEENWDTSEPAPIIREVKRHVRSASPNLGRALPFSEEAEQHVIACCLLDGNDTIARCHEAHVTPLSFHVPANRVMMEVIMDLYAKGHPVTLEVIAEELNIRRLLEAVGGLPYLMQVTSKIPTTAHAGYFIEKVRQAAGKRELIRRATELVEHAYNGDSLEEVQQAAEGMAKIEQPRRKLVGRSPFQFIIPPDGDSSVLLGNRYLNRGDGAVLSSTSGMGKSSMCGQMAIEYALELAPFGIKGNGPLKSLIIQSEDSDGDVAEVVLSIKHKLNLTPQQMAEVNERVMIVTDRVNRGAAFLASLKRLIDLHKPDLVWINPLQAFLDGDVTDSQDLGRFLREGLNSLNEPASFAYILVHHTTKPATGKDRAQRLWHEVMYDMAGGAEIINWARAILSLRAAEQEGDFNLVLAKRGRRAGVTVLKEQGAGYVDEVVTTIPLRHAQGSISVPGVKRPISLIYWESREPDQKHETMPDKSGGGRPTKYDFNDVKSVFPVKSSAGLPLSELHRAIIANIDIKKPTLHNVLKRWEEQGVVEAIRVQGQPMRYRQAL